MSLLTCEWRKLAFANYIVTPEIVQKHLPPFKEIDFYNGNCYVSLVGFQFKNVEIADVKVPLHTNFEEINLRFYVKRFDGTSWRKGTVFISEITDRAALSILANSIFHENYQTMPTKQEVKEEPDSFHIAYSWKKDENWQQIKIISEKIAKQVLKGSETHFIIDRPYGYGKHKENSTNEYKISHPLWDIYSAKEYDLNVDFTKNFGAEFSILNNTDPYSVFVAEGSHVSVEGRDKIKGAHSPPPK